jgi:hypothetical protein
MGMRRKLSKPLVAALCVAAFAGAATAYRLLTAPASAGSARPLAAHRNPLSTPSAADFADVFVMATNGYAQTHRGAGMRFSNVHCVQGSPGHYMCSYTADGSGRVHECHLVQAQWTPGRASTVTVTLAGRVKRCRTLRDAIRSLD